jgi:hypothetical protein
MVSVKGQLDAPVLDVSSMQQDYWERQEVLLPSLARLNKPKGWRKYFRKEEAPKLVLKRLDTTDWENIQNQHYVLRKEILKDMPTINKLASKMKSNKEDLTEKEVKYLVAMDEKTKPMMLSILKHMIHEPKMTYEEVVIMYQMLDDFDSKTLMAIVNAMTSEKASVTQIVTNERTAEIHRMRNELGVSQ